MSDSSRVQLFGLKESSWGVTPASALQALRFTSESLNYNIANVASEEIRDDRQQTDLIQTSQEAGGGFNLELSYGSFDEYLAAALFSAGWSTLVAVAGTDISAASADNSFNSTTTDFTTENINVGQWLKVGGFTDPANNGYAKVVSVAATKVVVSGLTLVTEAAGDSVTMAGSMIRNSTTMSSFTLEKKFSDITQFISYTGMVPATMVLNIAAQAVMTGAFSFLGKNSAIAQTTVGTGAPTDANANEVMNSGNHIGSVREAGTEVTSAYIQSLGINVDNNLRGKPAIGVVGNAGISAGTINVSGEMAVYFEDEQFYEKYVNGTASSVDFRVTDPNGNTYIVTLPRIKFTTGEVVSGGNNQDVLVNAGYQALRDATTDCTIQIDRIAA